MEVGKMETSIISIKDMPTILGRRSKIEYNEMAKKVLGLREDKCFKLTCTDKKEKDRWIGALRLRLVKHGFMVNQREDTIYCYKPPKPT